ncbi:superoxide dismutase family protein [Actinoplanes sp. NPDC049118]|uniref:superoxide dismutase family protein n=1 Tax=Actinoplanes sp. NPDC049118 TaxID=3155769 RepID=UPI0033ED2C40
MRLRRLALPLLLTAALTGCTDASPSSERTYSPPPGSTPWFVSGPPTSARPSHPASGVVPGAPMIQGMVTGTFLPFPQSSLAITYDPKVVPPGSTAQVVISRAPDGTRVRLSVTGMVPRRTYGAHLHRQPCTSVPEDAGPHYQHVPDPKAAASPPSVDPSYANPRNEVWLDFTADAMGAATVSTGEKWHFDKIEPPRSLIIHAKPTSTAPGKAGTAGPRVACLTLTTQ